MFSILFFFFSFFFLFHFFTINFLPFIIWFTSRAVKTTSGLTIAIQ